MDMIWVFWFFVFFWVGGVFDLVLVVCVFVFCLLWNFCWIDGLRFGLLRLIFGINLWRSVFVCWSFVFKVLIYCGVGFLWWLEGLL